MTEFELKFEIPPTHLKSVAVAVLEGKATRQRLQASYFDTPDGVLAAHGMVVRLRKEGRRWVQTAKGSTADVLERLEHNVTVAPQGAGVVPALDLSRHHGTSVGKAIGKALGLKGNDNYPSLELLYGTDVQRISRQIAHGTSVVEIALDQGRVVANGHSQSICELEVELKEGTPRDAVDLARQWCAAHGLWISTIAKSMKGQRLRQAVPFGAATSAARPQYAPQVTAHDMMSAVVQACLGQILPNASELASGSQNPDHVHQLRIGVRRLRTALRELASLTDAIDPAWEDALVQAFRALGAHRDQSHLALVFQPQLLAAGGPAIDFNDTHGKPPDAGETVRAPDFQAALLGLLGFVRREATDVPDTPGALKKAVAVRLDKLHRRALRDGKKFLALSEADQHGVRKRLKRLRYLIELTAPLFGADKRKRMATALKPVQEALGLYNDELMALHAWCAMLPDEPNAWFGIGWLTARKLPNAKRCLKEIKAFADIKPFWS
ncbi:MAG: CHAD domain-containing protein [Polaromonas sp.]